MKKLAAQAIGLGLLALSSTSALAMQVDIFIDKSTQRMTVKVDGVQKYDWPVSTAGRGYSTPSGNFHVFRLEKDHFSQEWDNAPMPNSMFFTGIGHAIHGSFHIKTLGQAVSHGCVRVLPANAAILYGLIQKAGFKNNSVTITGGFFDTGPKLTTEETFHMKPNEFGHKDANLQQQDGGGLFGQRPFWQLQQAPQQAADATIDPKDKKKKKKKKPTNNLFDYLKANDT